MRLSVTFHSSDIKGVTLPGDSDGRHACLHFRIARKADTADSETTLPTNNLFTRDAFVF